MRKILLGSTGLMVSAICLGTVKYGGIWDDEVSFAAMEHFVQLGGNFLDTARVYADWVPTAERQSSEKCIGRWLTQRGGADDIIVATKGGHHPLDGSGPPTLKQEELLAQSEESRCNLRLDAIPLYYLHRDDPSLSVQQIMDAVFTLQDRGIILHAGCSNWTAPRIRAAQAYAKSCGRPGFEAVSNRWSLARVTPGSFDPTTVLTDEELMQFHRETQIPLLPFSSMGQGVLSKLADGALPAWMQAQYGLPVNAELAKRAEAIAKKRGISVAQVCQCFFYGQDFPVIPVAAFSSDRQMKEAAKATELLLSEEELAALSIK